MAIIAAFRGSRRRRVGNQMVLNIPAINKNDAAKSLIGKKVVWTSPSKDKNTITGRVSAVHGNKGCVRAIFEKGMPGQSLGTEVNIE